MYTYSGDSITGIQGGPKVLFDDQKNKKQQQSLVSVILKYGLKAHYSATATAKNIQFNTTNVYFNVSLRFFTTYFEWGLCAPAPLKSTMYTYHLRT